LNALRKPDSKARQITENVIKTTASHQVINSVTTPDFSKTDILK
jgi:hypothetical protein